MELQTVFGQNVDIPLGNFEKCIIYSTEVALVKFCSVSDREVLFCSATVSSLETALNDIKTRASKSAPHVYRITKCINFTMKHIH